SSESPIDLAPNHSVQISVSFQWRRTGTDTGWFVVNDASKLGAPVTVPFQVHEVIPGGVLSTVLWLSAALALLLIFAVAITLSGREKTITEGPTWSFKDSWASNLTAVGAILGTVLAASGFLSDVLPGLS